VTAWCRSVMILKTQTSETYTHVFHATGVFVTLGGHRRDGMVHITQVSEDVNFTRDDEDADKITALEYFCPMGSQVPPPSFPRTTSFCPTGCRFVPPSTHHAVSFLVCK